MQQKARKSTILTQFLMFTLPLVILAVAVTSAVLVYSNYIHHKRTITQDYRNIIRASANEIGIYMEFALKNMEALAWLLSTEQRDPYAHKMALTAFNQVNSQFKHVSLISPTGRTIASTRWNDDDGFALDDNLFRKTLSGRSGYGDILFEHQRFPEVSLAVPLPGFGKTKGLVWGVLDLKFVWNVLEGISIGQSGQVYIVDATGKYIAHRHVDKVLTDVSQVPVSTLGQIRKAGAPIQWFEKEGDTRYYCLGTWLPQMDWIVVLRQPYQEIYLYLFRNLYWAALITGIACTVAVVFGFYRTRVFLKPIQKMHRQVKLIGQGDLEQTVTVASSREIGELAKAFNEMTASLKALIAKEIQSARELSHAQDLAVLGATAGKVTHEVGNLLNNMSMAAIALKDETLSADGTQALARMEKESDRVKAFIQSYLQFAKPPEARFSMVAMAPIIREALAMHEPAAKQKRVVMEFDWPGDAPKVPADAALIYQVFNNLIKNSMEAMDHSGRLKVAGKVGEQALEITVEDNGSGIAAEDRERIFEPFFTTKGNKGTGLGMAIAKSTITAHRGTITCKSAPGKGTLFLIRLPLR